jgi:hypothetical protein
MLLRVKAWFLESHLSLDVLEDMNMLAAGVALPSSVPKAPLRQISFT